MKQLLPVYKPKGMTPLAVIGELKKKFPQYADKKIGYAGRLDPLAHGLLLLMIGEETTKQKDKFLNLPKNYEFEALFGIETDTYDVLGIIKKTNATMKHWNNYTLKQKINSFIKTKLGKQKQFYPPFSSKTVAGKPLFWWAKEKKLSEITIPQREIEIYNCTLNKINHITKEQLAEEVLKQIALVDGDFRQEEITKAWQQFITDTPNKTFFTATFSLSCSSGTYVRSFIHTLGQKVGIGAIALDILRTKVGNYTLKEPPTIIF